MILSVPDVMTFNFFLYFSLAEKKDLRMVCKPWQLLIDQDFFDLACRRVYGDDWRSQRKNDTAQDMVRREMALYRFMWDVRVKLAAHWCVPRKAAVRYASPFEEINHLCVFEENEEYNFFILFFCKMGLSHAFTSIQAIKLIKKLDRGRFFVSM